MNILVVGCGKVGQTIVQQLSKEKHDISVIDVDAGVVSDMTNAYDVMGVVGNGESYEVLRAADIESADLMIAVTDSDEKNLLSCLLAKQVAGCNTIARVRNPIYGGEIRLIKEALGLSMTVNPEYAAAREIGRLLKVPSAIKVETFCRGRIELLKANVMEGSILDGCALVDVDAKIGIDVLICVVERGDEVVIPKGDFVLQKGDRISAVMATEKVPAFFTSIGESSRPVRNVMLIGGGKIAYYLADSLHKSGMTIKIIEKDPARCTELAEKLPGCIVIEGDAADQEVLLEEGIAEMDAVVTLTGIDEENIFLSLYAKSISKGKIITKITRLSFDNIVDGLDLGSVVYPKKITAESIVRFVRAMQNSYGSNVETLYNLIENKVEALEFVVREMADYVDVPLAELERKDNVLVAAIWRNGENIQPNGRTRIQVGDSVIVVTTQKGIDNLNELFHKKA
ncbi:MAG: Trk system potassium transporter TrkA [Lachnospiraceae bacterium]|nr:Trk system potassium transporter TrkA [Lachnospiraceae bacterium]